MPSAAPSLSTPPDEPVAEVVRRMTSERLDPWLLSTASQREDDSSRSPDSGAKVGMRLRRSVLQEHDLALCNQERHGGMLCSARDEWLRVRERAARQALGRVRFEKSAMNKPTRAPPEDVSVSQPGSNTEAAAQKDAVAGQVIDIVSQLVSEVHSSFGTAPGGDTAQQP